MLYKLEQTNGVFDTIKPVAFQNLALEKHLEDLLADNLLDVLFEDQLMPVFQERARQAEADIYALNKTGDLVIFELKRGGADGSAVHQILRYSEEASRWKYGDIQSRFAKYNKDQTVDLLTEHQNNFNLDKPLEKQAFNTKQHLIVVGNAGDDALVDNINYWKSKGIWIDFIPYRVYPLGIDHYFEFFSIPYDRHQNPGNAKGVLFDTNRSYNENSIWYMCEKNRVAAFGSIKGVVDNLHKGDLVFLYHKGEGILAAGKVKGEVKMDIEQDALYRDLEWLTSKPTKGINIKAMPASQIKKILNRDFWWAKTLKVPYLSTEEANKLLEALRTALG